MKASGGTALRSAVTIALTLPFLIMGLQSGQTASAPPWPMLHQNLQRTAATSTSIFTSGPTQRWRFDGLKLNPQFGGVNSPVVGPGGVVYITAAPKAAKNPPSNEPSGVFALDEKTGKVKWRLPTGATTNFTEDVKGPPALGPDGTLYVVFSDQLVALKDNGTSFTVLWTYQVSTDHSGDWEAFTDGPTVAPNGHIYVPTEGGFLAAIAPPASGGSTGTAVWGFQTAPTLAGNTNCVNPSDPNHEQETDLKSQPAIASDGTFFVGSDEPQGVAYHLKDNGTSVAVLNSVTIDPSIVPDAQCNIPNNSDDMNSTPAVDQGRGQVYFASDSGNLYAFKTTDMSMAWTGAAGGRGNSPEDSIPAIAPSGVVIVGSNDGSVYAFKADGSSAWTKTPCGRAGFVESSGAISGNGLVVIGTNCGLFAYTVVSGSLAWRFGKDTVEFSPAIADGLVLFPTDSLPTTSTNGEESRLTALSAGVVLTVAVKGKGTVTSSPPGIKCPGTCKASFAPGTKVKLGEKPAQGSHFAGWSGSCTGTGKCSVTMTGARSVKATFAT